MSLKNIQLRDNEAIDNSNTNRDFLENYHQQAANLNDSDQKKEFIIGQNNSCLQVGNDYLQGEMTIQKDVAVAADRVPVDGDFLKLVNFAFAYCFKEGRLSATGVSDIEHN